MADLKEATKRARAKLDRIPDSDAVTLDKSDARLLVEALEAIRHNWRTQKPELFHGVTGQILRG